MECENTNVNLVMIVYLYNTIVFVDKGGQLYINSECRMYNIT